MTERAAEARGDAVAEPPARWSRWTWRTGAVAVVCTALKLWIASSTFGTDDVRYWAEFTAGVAADGPFGIYGISGFEAPYNHPPLIGLWLFAVSGIADLGVPVPLLIRAPACLADLVSSLLLLSLLRRRVPERTAGLAACAFAASPLLFVVSGFHGNTDPVFIMLVLISAHALIARRSGLVSGVALGLAVSIKLTPVVMGPVLLLLAWRRGGRAAAAFLGGGAVVGLVVWLPALILRGPQVVSQVLGYSGVGPRQWGLSQLARWLGASSSTIQDAGDSLRLLSVALAAFLPVLAARYARIDEVALLGLPLCLFLFLSPAFGYQYLAWAVGPAYLVAGLRLATAYSVISGITATWVYSGWNNAPPWDWYEARSTPTPPSLLPILQSTWLLLGWICISVLAPRPRREDIDT